MRVRLSVLALILFASACGSDTPTAPSGQASRIIELSGNLNFEQVEIGQERTRTFRVRNAGTITLSVTGLSSNNTTNFTATPVAFAVQPNAEQTVTVFFRPTAIQSYTGTIRVESNATSGTDTISYAGSGFTNAPPFSQSGVGNNVFTLPAYVNRVRIQASPGSSCQNFAVRRNGSLIVNTILGTCSVADTRTYDGTHLLTGGGGTIEIIISEGVSWTFTEVR